jgi:hypothetical protein
MLLAGYLEVGIKEEFDATIIPDFTLLMLGRHGADVLVFHSENHVQGCVIVGDLHVGLWQMLWFVAHVVADSFGLNVLPCGLVPIGVYF